MTKFKNILAAAGTVAFATMFTGCATEGPAPRTHADSIHIGVDTNGVPVVDIVKYDNPKDLLISYDPATKTFSLKSSNNPSVIDSSSAANAAYINALDELITDTLAAGSAAAGKGALGSKPKDALDAKPQ